MTKDYWLDWAEKVDEEFFSLPQPKDKKKPKNEKKKKERKTD
jgi:hypothetical protein